jgi:hypothetical protein
MRMVVDLPAPLGPRKPKTSPGGTVSDRSLTATVVRKCFVSSSVRTAGVAVDMVRVLPAQWGTRLPTRLPGAPERTVDPTYG